MSVSLRFPTRTPSTFAIFAVSCPSPICATIPSSAKGVATKLRFPKSGFLTRVNCCFKNSCRWASRPGWWSSWSKRENARSNDFKRFFFLTVENVILIVHKLMVFNVFNVIVFHAVGYFIRPFQIYSLNYFFRPSYWCHNLKHSCSIIYQFHPCLFFSASRSWGWL